MGEVSTGAAERSLPTMSWLGCCTLCFFLWLSSSPLARFLRCVLDSSAPLASAGSPRWVADHW